MMWGAKAGRRDPGAFQHRGLAAAEMWGGEVEHGFQVLIKQVLSSNMNVSI